MKFLILFLPALLAMAWAMRLEIRRKSKLRIFTLTLISAVVIIRYFLMAIVFGGAEISPIGHIVDYLASLYVIPTMYMYLCDQCGTRWNNDQAIFMLIIPLICIFFPSETYLQPLIVVIQCITVSYCMVRLWFRIRDYKLVFSKWMKVYYVWMFVFLFFMAVGHCLGADTATQPAYQWLYMVLFSLLIITGYIFIPASFEVSPVTTEDEGTTITELDSFMEKKNVELIQELHRLMVEEQVYLRPNLHIEDLANMLATNRTYITRLMRSEFNMSFNDFISERRVEYSQKLLADSDLPLGQIALSAGFSNSSSYCRVFKRITGMTPMTWKTARQK